MHPFPAGFLPDGAEAKAIHPRDHCAPNGANDLQRSRGRERKKSKAGLAVRERRAAGREQHSSFGVGGSGPEGSAGESGKFMVKSGKFIVHCWTR